MSDRRLRSGSGSESSSESSSESGSESGSENKITFAIGRFVNCCATLSGQEWCIEKEIVRPKDHPIKVTIPPCTDVKVKYQITVDRKGDLKLCVFTLLKLKVSKDTECNFKIKVVVVLNNSNHHLGEIIVKSNLHKGLNCLELCKCFDVSLSDFEEIVGRNIRFLLESNDCIKFKEGDACECELTVPETPTDTTTPSVVFIKDEVNPDNLKGPKDCGDGSFPANGFPIEVDSDAIAFPYTFCYCRTFKGTECDCRDFPKKITDTAKLCTDAEGGCVIDKDSAKLIIKCCDLKLKIRPPKVECDISWCICKEAEVLHRKDDKDKTCIKYTVTLTKNDGGAKIKNGFFLVKGCEDFELINNATITVVGGGSNFSEEVEIENNKKLKFSEVDGLVDELITLINKDVKVCITVSYRHRIFEVSTGELTIDDGPLCKKCLHDCVDIPKCDDDKIKFCEQFSFKPYLGSKCYPTLDLCDPPGNTPEEIAVVTALIAAFNGNLTEQACVDLPKELTDRDDIELCYVLCIPDNCCNKHGKLCIVNKATVCNDPCDNNDWDKCERSFENSSSTSTVIKCKVCEGPIQSRQVAKPQVQNKKRYATIIKRQ